MEIRVNPREIKALVLAKFFVFNKEEALAVFRRYRRGNIIIIYKTR